MAGLSCLPHTQPAAFLGLADKYVGFAAVESIWTTDTTACAVLCESGRVGWLSEQSPRKVWLNGTDVTDQVKKDGSLYTLDCPEKSDKACCPCSGKPKRHLFRP